MLQFKAQKSINLDIIAGGPGLEQHFSNDSNWESISFANDGQYQASSTEETFSEDNAEFSEDNAESLNFEEVEELDELWSKKKQRKKFCSCFCCVMAYSESEPTNNVKTYSEGSLVSLNSQLTGLVVPKSTCVTRAIVASQIILFISALLFVVMAVYLSYQDITQLVGQSIPQIAIGLGILTLVVSAVGWNANQNVWVCGFYIEACCLLVLLLSEIFVICACVFQNKGILCQSDVFWSALSDAEKGRIMANWQCCAWENTCDVTDDSSIYYEYRHYQGSSCLDASKNDLRNWMMDVVVIFGCFASFHIIYIIYTCVCQAGRIKKATRNKVADRITKYKQQQKRAWTPRAILRRMSSPLTISVRSFTIYKRKTMQIDIFASGRD